MLLDTAGTKGSIDNLIKLPNGARGMNIRSGNGIDAL
jgi:hypothetical protein